MKDESYEQEIGYANSINQYLVWVNGLPNVKINELVVSEQKAHGLVTAIKDDLVEVLMLDDVKIKPQETFKRTLRQLTVSIGSHLLGRTINPLGQPIDGKGGFANLGQSIEIEEKPQPIKAREQITRQFETGISIVDMLVPLSYGQRELIIGEPHSGKTGFLLDTIINQAGKKNPPAGGQVVCVYTLIGKPLSEIRNLVEILRINKASEYTIVVATSSSEKAPLGFLAPAVGVSIAQYFQKRGQDVLLILDDLGIHAKLYREIALLSGKSPGRQSYPGDIFYQQAKLIERAGNFNKSVGGGSITALPVIEVSTDDFSSFISTNLMGMTDGHLKFDSSRYHQGIKPSIDVSLSVSRVGRQTQILAQKNLADRIKAILAEGVRLEALSRLGSDISPQTQHMIKQSKQIEEILKQVSSTKIPIIVQMILLGLTFTPLFLNKDANFVKVNKELIIKYLTTKIDLTKLEAQVRGFKDEKQLIQSLAGLIPNLEKICRA